MWFGDRLARQNDHENRSHTDLAADHDLTAVVFNQFSGKGQPQPDARLLGREVRLKDLSQRFRRNARAGVGDLDPDVMHLRAQFDLERATARHRLHRVDRQVRETGLELFGVAFEMTVERLASAASFFHDTQAHALLIGLGAHEVHHLLNQTSRIDIAQLEARRAAITEKITDHSIEPCEFVFDRIAELRVIGACGLGGRRELVAYKIYREIDEVQGIADLVSDAGGNTSGESRALDAL